MEQEESNIKKPNVRVKRKVLSKVNQLFHLELDPPLHEHITKLHLKRRTSVRSVLCEMVDYYIHHNQDEVVYSDGKNPTQIKDKRPGVNKMFHLQLDPDLHTYVKIRAAEIGTTTRVVICEIVDFCIQSNDSRFMLNR